MRNRMFTAMLVFEKLQKSSCDQHNEKISVEYKVKLKKLSSVSQCFQCANKKKKFLD